MAKEVIALVLDIDVPENGSPPTDFSFDGELLKVIESGCAANGMALKGRGKIYNDEIVYELEKT